MKRQINGKTYSKTIGVKKGELAVFGTDGELTSSGKKPSDILPSEIPSGGTTGQVLTKTRDGIAWDDIPPDTIQGEDGKLYKIVACVLRCEDGTWKQVGGAHAPINVNSITQGVFSIRVNYSFKATNVVSFIAAPDETFSALGYMMGASVGDEYADIHVYKHDNLGGYIAGQSDGTFACMGNISAASMAANGLITITHDSSLGVGRSLIMRENNTTVPVMGSAGATSDSLILYDDQGQVITQVTTSIKLYWTATGITEVTPAQANTSGNIWCLGIFDVTPSA